MVKKISIAPPHSLILVMDVICGVAPDEFSESALAFTSSCVAIGCLAEVDGPTEISFTQEALFAPIEPPSFDGVVETPRHQIAVCTVFREPIFEEYVADTKARVRVWVNDPGEPNRIFILVD